MGAVIHASVEDLSDQRGTGLLDAPGDRRVHRRRQERLGRAGTNPARHAGRHVHKSEWGWLCSSAVWGWIATRAEQAATEGWNAEHAIRDTGLTPDPWLAGAIHAALPKLFEACPDLDCAKPVGEWSRDEITELLLAAFNLIQRAIEARDATETKVAGKPTSADIVARQTNGSVGNPRMTADEFNNLPPFA
jgi:hypothetical protein